MNRLLFFLLFCIPPSILVSQKTIAQNSLKDTVIINGIIAEVDTILANEPKVALKLIDSAFVIAKNLGLEKKQHEIIRRRIDTQYYLGKYKKAISDLFKLLSFYESLNDTLNIAITYNDIGATYNEMTEYHLALEYFQKAIRIRNNNGSIKETATTIGNIGLTYIHLAKNKEALEYLNKALLKCKEVDYKEGIATLNGNIGMVYKNQKKYKTALKHHKIALKIYQEINSKDGIANELNNIGLINYFDGKLDDANIYFKKSATLRKEMGDNNGYLYAINNIAHVYKEQKRYKTSLKYLKEGLSISNKSNDKQILIMILEKMALIYSELGDYKNAYKYQGESHTLYNEIFNTEKSEQIEELKIEFETEQKEAEIKNLKDITTLQNESLERRQMIIFLLIGTLLLIGLILYFGITRYRLKTEQQALKLEQEALKLEQRLLRSQMNPHFIFNSLSVIQGYIFKGSTKEAAGYLSSFAKLMRHILENSREEYVALEKEIDTLEHYLKLQNIRNEGKINYLIKVDNKIDAENISVPPMIAQPFIENSIKHGFKDEQNLSIKINYISRNNSLFLSIEDDGIGINSSKNISKIEKSNHNSLAISITESRLQLLSKNKKEKFNFSITDISEENPEQTGTRIEIELPFLEEF